MNERILISENKGRAMEFEGSVQKAIKRLNALIDQFHKYQTWQKIESESDFLKLITDPKEYFDEVMINNSGITTSAKLNPEVLAQLLGTDRGGWMQYVNATSTASVMDYDNVYMTFREGKIYPDAEAIKTKQQTFAVYAETPGQKKIVETFRGLVDTLNWLQAENICNGTEVETAATALKLFYSRDTGRVMQLDPMILQSLIYGR